MASAWTTSASASARRPAPRARAIADEIPPPMAPADIICISISTGKTSATPASASVPSLATKYVSMSPTDACTNMTSTFGVASRRSVLTIGPSSSTRVRVSKRGAVAGGAASSLRDPAPARTSLPFGDITMSMRRTCGRCRHHPVEGTVFVSGSWAVDRRAECRPVHAAIDEDLGPVDVRGIVRREEQDRLGDLVGVAPAIERHALLHLLGPRFGDVWRDQVIAPERCPNETRRHGVDAYAAVGKLRCHRLPHAPNARLTRGIGACAGEEAGARGDRAVENDGGAALKEGQSGLDREKNAGDVGPEDFVEGRLRHVRDRADFDRAGIGKDDVEAAKPILDHGEQGLAGRTVQDVASERSRLFAQLLGRRIERVLIAPGDDDLRALGDEPVGRGEADAAIAACDQSDLAGEPHMRLRATSAGMA